MAGKPQKYSLRTILGIAYNQNIQNIRKNASSESRKNDDSEKPFNYTDDFKKFYDIIDGLCCYINHISLPPEKRYTTKGRWIHDNKVYDIKLNEVTKCVIVALMTMDSSNGSFISKLINHKFNEITYIEKLEYILAVIKQLENIEISVNKDYLIYNFNYSHNYENVDSIDESLLNEAFRITVLETIEILTGEFRFEAERTKREECLKKDIYENIESVLREYFPHEDRFSLPYPSCEDEYALGKKKLELSCNDSSIVYLIADLLKSLNICYFSSDSPTKYLESEEKEYMLNTLEWDVHKAIFDWRYKANNAILKKFNKEVDYIFGLM